MEKIKIVDCRNYIEDLCICDDEGEPKGQCATCGAKYYEHNLDILTKDDYRSAQQIQNYRGIIE